MSEGEASYQGGEKIIRAVSCECGNPLWQEVIEGEKIYLDVAGLEILHFSGTCGDCGRRLEWHCNQVRLERLVERVMRQRKCE